MNDAQRFLVIIALVVIGFVLTWLMLEWGDGWGLVGDPILVFYERPLSQYPNLTGQYGIYAVYGISHILGILFGVVLPLCLFASAAFLAFGRRKT
jgi:hypothetical protein